eukprot:6196528-Pleurochrysis_carterae.AAC.1
MLQYVDGAQAVASEPACTLLVRVTVARSWALDARRELTPSCAVRVCMRSLMSYDETGQRQRSNYC